MKSLIAAGAFGIVMMLSGVLMKKKEQAFPLALVLLFLLLGVSIWELTDSFNGRDIPVHYYFNDMLRIDSYSMWFNIILCALALIYVLMNREHIFRVGQHVSEYYALLFFILVGGFLLTGFNNLLILFIGIEIISIPQYVLAGSDKGNLRSTEASLKYLLTGAFSTGMMLMGIALLYGAMHTFDISQFDWGDGSLNLMSLAGIIFLIFSLGFKVSASPMHFWTPDVYDGAPTTFTTIMATIVKSAVFVGFMRLFKDGFGAIGYSWTLVLMIVTVLTLLIGNITAVYQQSVKRMLTYSSISQAGFMLFAILASNAMGMKGMILYAIAYSVATIGLFTIVAKLKDHSYDGFNGLARQEPFLAFAAAIFLLSLAGIPLTGGFFAKYYMLTSVMGQGGYMVWLVIFALLMAAVSTYYYFRVIWAMYFKSGEPEITVSVNQLDRLMFGLASAIIVVMGIMPSLFVDWV